VKNAIEERLNVLLGQRWCAIGRVADLVCLEFGQRRRVRDYRGKWRTVGEWALHLQCSWRIGGPQGLIVASDDRYWPAGDPDDPPKKWKWDTGPNRFDERVKRLLPQTAEGFGIVQKVRADRFGGLQIVLTNSLIIQVFPSDTLDREYDEHWRFFQPKRKSKHFVVTNRGVTNGKRDGDSEGD
jgi:hypothetical protein